ncbi:hypothetical protein [Frankia sp. KB5]|uniref:hypothetical protein n=1 Tax=Frankia sp. KB5 TaxID=683318 RepID=UPI0012FF6288|nr:hypothetical protein [Frankia sp. KB5]
MERAAMLDLRENSLPDVIEYCKKALDVEFRDDGPTFGWGGKSAGFGTSRGTWVKILSRATGSINERTWTGEECASVLSGVSKPRLLRSIRWSDEERGVVWRADETTLVSFPAVSSTPEIRNDSPGLSNTWWSDLGESLAALARQKTTRVGVRQDLINRRIREFAGDAIDSSVDEWTTAHADVHWANLTAPTLVLLDWEGWGLGPRGLDAATLWVFSLLAPSVAERVSDEFSEDLSSRSGKIAQLFMCVELLKMVRDYGDHPDLEKPLSREADRLVTELAESTR